LTLPLYVNPVQPTTASQSGKQSLKLLAAVLFPPDPPTPPTMVLAQLRT